MATQKKSSAASLANFFSNLFHNFPKLLLTNLLFAVPFAAFFGIFYLINTVTGINSNIILFLTAIPLFPFFAGVTQVTSHMVRGDESVGVVSNFIAGVKDNFLRFLVHGIVFYLAIFFSYYSIVMYINLGKQNGMFFLFLAVSILVSVFFLFAFYYIPPMTVTFDISMKNIYKNSALMTFGELKHNLLATFGIVVLTLISATILMCCTHYIAVIIATIVLGLFFMPSLLSYVINSAVYNSMYEMIIDRKQKSKAVNERMAAIKNQNSKLKEEIASGISDLDIDENGDSEEYIYFNGKMVKRSVLLELKNNNDNTGDEQ